MNNKFITPPHPQLRSSEQDKFQSLLNSLKGHEEFTLDPSGIIISSNLEAVAISGYEEWEVIGKHISLFYTEEDCLNNKPQKDLEKTAKLGKYISSGFRVKKRGATFWSKMKFSAIALEDGVLAGYRVTLFDSTHRAMYTLSTRRMKDEYLSLFNNSFIGIFKFSLKDFTFVMLNEKALQIIGKEREHLSVQQLFYCKQEFADFRERLRTSKSVEHFEFRLNREDHEAYCSISCKVFPIGGFVEGIISDITEKRRQLIQLEKLNTELDNFLYHASHDIRAPLTSILGLINLIKADNHSQNPAQYVEKIAEQVKHMDVLLKDLSNVAFNNSQALNTSELNPEKLITDILKPFLNEYPFIQPIVAVEANAPFHSDLIRVATILTNIISNAFKYYNPKETSPFVKISFKADHERAMIQIQDNGCGIDETHINDIFKLFFKMDSRGKGSGLGLYVVQIMMEKLGGKVNVVSKVDIGTCITISLPNLKEKTSDRAFHQDYNNRENEQAQNFYV